MSEAVLLASCGGFELYRLRAPNPSFFTGPGTNTYLLRGPGEEVAVIDPGPDDHPAHAEAVLAAAGRLGKLRQVLLTHAHPDHAGAVAAIVAASGASLLAWPTPNRLIEVPGLPLPDHPLADGEAFEAAGVPLVALHTPGHASDHLCFWMPDAGRMVSGDMVIGTTRVVIIPPDGDLRAYMASLGRLAAIPGLHVMSSGHGEDLADPAMALARVLEKRLARERHVIQALERGRTTLGDLARGLYAGLNPTQDPMMTVVTERHVLAHLLKLLEEGVVEAHHPDPLDPEGRWALTG